MKYLLPTLPFAYDALEPYIDAKTMDVHLNGHHKAYVEDLNSVLHEFPHLQKKVEGLLSSLDSIPEEIRTNVAQNAGGHANHTLFWSLLTPKQTGLPSGNFGRVLETTFESFLNFQQRFTELASDHFSNGWAWLCTNSEGRLTISTTKDHESPLTYGLTPLVVLDLWEHAYYLKNQNRRSDYIDAFWEVINWTEVQKRWDDFVAHGATSREWQLAA